MNQSKVSLLSRLFAGGFWGHHTYMPVLLGFYIVYLILGSIVLFSSPITGDELAHLSAAHGISQGQAINLEHPPILKSLNGLVIALFYPGLETNDDGQWSRSIDYLVYSSYEPYHIIWASRFVYLLFNSLILVGLIMYTCIWKFLNPSFSIVLAILFTFSPSILAHTPLLLFDVAGSVTAFMAIVSLVTLLQHWLSLSEKSRQILTLLSAVWLTLAVNVKFSNIILIPIFLVAIGVYIVSHKSYKEVRLMLKYASYSALFGFVSTWLLYILSFYRSQATIVSFLGPIAKLIEPAYWYMRGLSISGIRSQDPFQNFVDDRFTILTFPQFVSRVIWFKENPFLIILLGCVILFLTYKVAFWLLTSSFLQKPLHWFQKNQFQFRYIGLWVLFPLLYMIIAWNSKLTIGYRHFYPVLIFIYAGIAWVATKLMQTNLLNRFITTVVLLGYGVAGIFAIPQGITYTNVFWTREKWRLATDSTITWGEAESYALTYLTENALLITGESPELGQDWNVVLDSNSGPNFHVHVIDIIGKNKRLEPSWDLFEDLRQTSIQDLNAEYLVVDAVTWQRLTVASTSNNIARENLEFISTQTPIFQKNNVIFIYKL